jgi:hypothetical protein
MKTHLNKYIFGNYLKFTHTRNVAFVLLALMLLSFGIMIPWLGYGFDEWHFIYYFTRGIQGIRELFHYDGHPQAVWVFILSFRLLGYSPLSWHIYSLFWRWLSVVTFWLCLKELWPHKKRQAFVVAALFALYPAYTLQIFPISYFEVWISYTLLFLSFFFTIKSIRSPEKFLSLFVLAVFLKIGQVFTREYNWFTELMRPVIIWYVLSRELNPKWKDKLIRTFKLWLPFLLIFSSALIWRGFFYTPLRKFFQVQSGIFTNPIRTSFEWALNIIPDIVIVLITSWFKLLNPDYLYLVTPLNVVILAIIIIVGLVLFSYLMGLKTTGETEQDNNWAKEALFIGLPGILFGVIPFYIAGYSIHLTEAPHNSRFALGMLPGAALIIASALEWAITSSRNRNIITAILVALLIGWHIRFANDFRKIWFYQSNFLRQLTWRVPGIKKGTALFSYQSSIPKLEIPTAEIALSGDFPLSMAINSLYQLKPSPTNDNLEYWYFSTTNDLINPKSNGVLEEEHATAYFYGNIKDSLLLYFDPQNGQCLHIIRPEDSEYRQYPSTMRELAPNTTLDAIEPNLGQNNDIRNAILGSNHSDWCFYFEKADLARQYRQWDAIPALWNEAQEHNQRSAFGMEYLPFIEGYARLGNWNKALDITQTANKVSKSMGPVLCPLWLEITSETPPSKEQVETFEKARDVLNCSPN